MTEPNEAVRQLLESFPQRGRRLVCRWRHILMVSLLSTAGRNRGSGDRYSRRWPLDVTVFSTSKGVTATLHPHARRSRQAQL